MKKILFLLISLLYIFALIGCNYKNQKTDDTTESKTNYIISTSDPNIELNAGERIYLDYKLNFKLDEDDNLIFTSSDETVAKVLSTGYVLAKKKGYCLITISYKDASLVYQVTVNQKIELVEPLKTDYFVGEEIDLTGAKILYYNNDSTINKEIEITESMIKGYDSSTTGYKTITVDYDGLDLKFIVNITEREFESYYIDEVIIPNSIKTNEKLEIKVINNKLDNLKEKIGSLYDYSKYKVLLKLTTPMGEIYTIYSFLTEDYKETLKETTINTSRVNEGIVNIKDGYNYKLTLTKSSDKYYMFRYLAIEAGTYDYVIEVIANNSIVVQTLNGEFEVTQGAETKGIVKVSSNNKTFELENGESILFVGENLAWYTSKDRRYKDYELWIDSLKENHVNYVRIWLSAFDKALFWSDYKCYDTKLDEAYELDKIFELLEENGIYCDLTIFHHGMFSAKTNPMWPNDENTWYTSKYGANPYSKLISNPKDFFTNEECLLWTENYLTYIASRYGYSNNLLSYEIFNEVDWVEAYDEEVGNKWHDRMAKLLKKIDYRGHLVTTSVRGDDFSNDIYSVFKLDSIDYVNVHNYGTYDYLTYIPKKVKNAYLIFNKPIIYQEVGYSGNSGSEQLTKDPNNISLHQEIWAGLMSSTASGMNWWWDSWIEYSDSYSCYNAAGIYKDLIDLSGNLELAYQNSKIKSSESKITTLGYLFNNKAYLYVFNTDYQISNTNAKIDTTIEINGMDNGSYKVSFFDTLKGEIIKEEIIDSSNQTLEINIKGTNDIALIINKK